MQIAGLTKLFMSFEILTQQGLGILQIVGHSSARSASLPALNQAENIFVAEPVATKIGNQRKRAPPAFRQRVIHHP